VAYQCARVRSVLIIYIFSARRGVALLLAAVGSVLRSEWRLCGVGVAYISVRVCAFSAYIFSARRGVALLAAVGSILRGGGCVVSLGWLISVRDVCVQCAYIFNTSRSTQRFVC